MSELKKVFSKLQIGFFGNVNDVLEYEAHVGRAANLDNNLSHLIREFHTYCNNNEASQHYFIHKINNKNISLVLYYNKDLKYDLYMMLYDISTNRRLYTAKLDEIANLSSNQSFNKILRVVPEICAFSEMALNDKREKDVWMLDDIKEYAQRIDKLKEINYFEL